MKIMPGTFVFMADRKRRAREKFESFRQWGSHRPAGLQDFAAQEIPELQWRGLFRAEYEGPYPRWCAGE